MASKGPAASTSAESSNPGGTSGNSGNGDNASQDSTFECNICLDTAKDAVISLCGHLFCWPCLHQWLETRPNRQVCPVCKAGISRDKVIPLYGRGSTGQQDPRENPTSTSGTEAGAGKQRGLPGFWLRRWRLPNVVRNRGVSFRHIRNGFQHQRRSASPSCSGHSPIRGRTVPVSALPLCRPGDHVLALDRLTRDSGPRTGLGALNRPDTSPPCPFFAQRSATSFPKPPPPTASLRAEETSRSGQRCLGIKKDLFESTRVLRRVWWRPRGSVVWNMAPSGCRGSPGGWAAGQARRLARLSQQP